MKTQKFSNLNSLYDFNLIVSLLLFFISSVSILASTFHVSNVSELQTALNNAAINGTNDTIVVKTGTYNVSSKISFWSDEEKSIVILGVNMPVFDGGNSTQIFEFMTVSDNGDIYLDGLKFQNGKADYGGGINIETQSADITLNNCIFINNISNIICGGANLYSITGNATITSCQFIHNSSPNTTGYPNGTAGGLFVQMEGDNTMINVIHCTFENNFAQRDGAATMLYPVGLNSTVIVKNNIFRNNTANEFGGGCWIRCPNDNSKVILTDNIMEENFAKIAGGGGGTYIEIASGTITVSDNIHRNNNSAWEGGGLWIEHSGGTLNVFNNIFINNKSLQNGGGANLYLDNGNANVHHNIFYNNNADGVGGGLNVSTTTGNLNIFNNTFYSNTASEAGDINFYFDNVAAGSNFYNNILYKSSTPALSYSGEHTIEARYSDIDGGNGESWFGTGCISVDPLFVNPKNGDFHLSWANFPANDDTKSPCIDAGDPTAPLDPDYTISDMGVYYYDQIIYSINENEFMKLPQVIFVHNYPNPFNVATTIEFYLKQSDNIKIEIFDINSNLISTIFDDYIKMGYHKFIWNAKNNHSGIYFCKLTTSKSTISKKILLIK